MKHACILSLVLVVLAIHPEAGAQAPPLKGYETKLFLDSPILPGGVRTITGGGAPSSQREGIWVELWVIPAAGGGARSLASTAASEGAFVFEGVPVSEGDAFFVTLSRSWQFNSDGDAEGWSSRTGDVLLDVTGGTLGVELRNLNGNAFTDSFIQTFFPFDPSYYRVVEIRFRNPAPPLPTNLLGIFWGSPWELAVSEHNARIPSEMEDFQTIQIPMNVEERCVIPCGRDVVADGLWDAGTLNDSLRLDPLNGIPSGDRSLDGTVFEIDFIRIREDYRREFLQPDDREGILTHDVAGLEVDGGFLQYTARDVGESGLLPVPDGVLEPRLVGGLDTGRLDTGYFTRFALGVEGLSVMSDPLRARILFDDDDSTAYRDDCPPPDCIPGTTQLQEGSFTLSAEGRQDVALVMDELGGESGDGLGEWTEDGGRVPAASLRLDLPRGASDGDTLRVDYFGWIPDAPFGPSDVIAARRDDTPFHRGDADDSGSINLSDAIVIITWLVSSGSEPVCLDSADANDDGRINLTDGIFLLAFTFQGGSPPPPPGPPPGPCAPDPTDDLLECGATENC